ncbi:hypothetical protein D1872_229260 [compost metagenome]
MANQNDNKILELKKQIDEKKKKISKSQKFTPITNGSIEVDGIRYNLHVISKEQLISLLVKLNSYALSAKDLGVLDDYTISGFNVLDWVTDLQNKYDQLNRKEEEQKLKAMENKLDQLLSSEKKVELEISEIESMLK